MASILSFVISVVLFVNFLFFFCYISFIHHVSLLSFVISVLFYLSHLCSFVVLFSDFVFIQVTKSLQSCSLLVGSVAWRLLTLPCQFSLFFFTSYCLLLFTLLCFLLFFANTYSSLLFLTVFVTFYSLYYF